MAAVEAPVHMTDDVKEQYVEVEAPTVSKRSISEIFKQLVFYSQLMLRETQMTDEQREKLHKESTFTTGNDTFALDDTYDDNIHGTAMDTLLGFTPTPAQRRAFIAIKECLDGKTFQMFKDADDITRHNTVYYADPVGTGKTLVAVALAAEYLMRHKHNGVPPPPIIHNCATMTNIGFQNPYVTIKRPKVVNCMLVFAPRAVLRHWQTTFATCYPSLRVYTVITNRDFGPLFEMMEQDSLDSHYDIVLAEMGNATEHSIRIPASLNPMINSTSDKLSKMQIFHMIPTRWLMSIVDDFAEMGDKYLRVGRVSACYHLMISATNSSSGEHYAEVLRKLLANAMKAESVGLRLPRGILVIDFGRAGPRDKGLVPQLCPVRNNLAVVERENNMFAIKCRVVATYDPRQALNAALYNMDQDGFGKLQHALNAGALEDAAAQVGAVGSSVTAIYQKFLGDKYAPFIKANADNDFAETVETAIFPMLELNDTYAYDMGMAKKHQPPQFINENVKRIIARLKVEAQHGINTHGAAIRRFEAEYVQGACSICCNSFASEEDPNELRCGVAISACCSNITCVDCVTNVLKHDLKVRQISCGKCKRIFRDLSGFIFIKDMDILNKLSDADMAIEEIEATTETTMEEVDTEPSVDLSKLDKFQTIVRIVQSKSINTESSFAANINLGCVMNGKRTNLTHNPKHNKVLVFADFKESRDKLDKAFSDAGVAHWTLQGTYDAINNIITDFHAYEGNAALIIDSISNCSGLNLQFATEIIFLHYLDDRAREEQVVGRGQRLGREFPLMLTYVAYRNEINDLVAKRGLVKI